MTAMNKLAVVLLSTLLAAVIVGVIVIVLVIRQQSIDERKAECSQWTGADYFLCLEQADR